MESAVIRSYGFWIVSRYYQYMTDNRTLHAFQKFLRYVEGEVSDEELEKAHKAAVEAASEAEDHYEKVKDDCDARASHLADDRPELTEERAWSWGLSIANADLAVERATVYIAKAVAQLTSGCDTFDDTDAVGEAVAQAAAELAYADEAEDTAKAILAGGKIPLSPWRVWNAAADFGFDSERAEQKKELLRLERKESKRATAAVA